MPDFLHQDLNIRSSTFSRLELSVSDYLNLYRDTRTWRYLGLVSLVLVSSDPTGLYDTLPTPVYFAGWALAITTYLVLHLAIVIALGAIRLAIPAMPFWMPLLTVLALVPSLVAMEAWLNWIMQGTLRSMHMDRLFFVSVTVIVFESIYMRFVMPRVLSERKATAEAQTGDASEAAQQDEQDQRVIHIGGLAVPVSEIQIVEAREHHVHVRLPDRVVTQRARLSDIIAQTRPEDGLQPHRSWWVGHDMVQRLDRDGVRPVLRLKDDCAVPVARGRLEDVRLWIEIYLD